MTRRFIPWQAGLSLLALWAALASGGSAGSLAQTDRELVPFVTFEGQVTEAAPLENWRFSALAGEVLSLLVEGDGDFDPLLALLDESADPVITSDDIAYPANRDALVEAITIPRTGTYTVQVSGFGGMTGSYALTLLRGYADLSYENAVDNAGWTALGRGVAVTTETGLSVGLQGINLSGAAQNPRLASVSDAYVEMSVTTITARNDWEVGLMLRQQGGRYLSVLVNARGQWQAALIDGETTNVLRDWTEHPAILPGETSFVLGVLAFGSALDVFYNGQFMGQVLAQATPPSGRTGVVVGTANAINSATEARIDRLTITTTRQINNERLFPQQLIAGSTSQLIQELERRGIIPAGGQAVLNVSESFSESQRPGIALVELGRGTTYSTFVMGTTARIVINSGSGPTGCGLMLRRTADDAYTLAYIASDGAYGLSQREGDTFAPGLYGVDPTFASSDNHALIVVATEDALHLFVNRVYAGSYGVPAEAGEVGNALVNFEATNATCNFVETWVWAWED